MSLCPCFTLCPLKQRISSSSTSPAPLPRPPSFCRETNETSSLINFVAELPPVDVTQITPAESHLCLEPLKQTTRRRRFRVRSVSLMDPHSLHELVSYERREKVYLAVILHICGTTTTFPVCVPMGLSASGLTANMNKHRLTNHSLSTPFWNYKRFFTQFHRAGHAHIHWDSL